MRALVLPIASSVPGPHDLPQQIDGLGQFIYVATGAKRVFRVRALVLLMSGEQDAGRHIAELVVRDGDERELLLHLEDGTAARVRKTYELPADATLNADAFEFWVELRAGSGRGDYALALKIDDQVVWDWPMLVMDTENLRRDRRTGS